MSEADLNGLDETVAAGEFPSRAEAVREGVRRVLREARERRIAEQYRQAYASHPQDPAVAEAGAILAAELIRREESAATH